MRTMLAALVLATASGHGLRDNHKQVEIVRIEWNVCYTPENGEFRFSQIIWWDLTNDGIRCIGYRMVGPATIGKYRFGERSVSWVDNGTRYTVHGTLHRTCTAVCDDPEMADRKRLPTRDRPKLFDDLEQ